MTNYVNYLQHVVNVPKDIYRHFAYDIAVEKDQENKQIETAQRIAVAALPLLCLYRPLSRTLSISLSGVRVLTNASQMISTYQKDSMRFSLSLIQVTLSVAALAANLPNTTSLASITCHFLSASSVFINFVNFSCFNYFLRKRDFFRAYKYILID